MRYPSDRIMAIHQVLKMQDEGDLTADQTLAAIRVESGYATRSPGSERLGRIIQQVDNGDLPISALRAVLDE